MRLAFLSTTVAPLGSGLGGGVELTIDLLHNFCKQSGLDVTVFAPSGSTLDGGPVMPLDGDCVSPAQLSDKNASVVHPRYALVQGCKYLVEHQDEFDCIVNFSYDMLPLYVTDFFKTPLLHYISMGNENNDVSTQVSRVSAKFPCQIAMLSQAQMATYQCDENNVYILKKGIDTHAFPFNPSPQADLLGWSGRISKENGCEDALQIAQSSGKTLRLFGKIQDEPYWAYLNQNYGSVIEYVGFLSQPEYGKKLSECEAFLMTPKWIEAFGNVVVEALACGVPVVSYDRGAPSEIVDSKVGVVVPADSISSAVESLGVITGISRNECREYAESHYSLDVFYKSFDSWLKLFAPVGR